MKCERCGAAYGKYVCRLRDWNNKPMRENSVLCEHCYLVLLQVSVVDSTERVLPKEA